MPLAVANSVGELAAHFRVERLRPVTGEESVAHSHPHLSTHRDTSRIAVCFFLYGKHRVAAFGKDTLEIGSGFRVRCPALP
jgi:hypothetical protein